MTRTVPIVLGLVAAFLILFALLTATTAPSQEQWSQADAALVLSGDVDFLRVKHAAELLKRGKVKALILTGRGAGGDSADAMREVAIAQGVPAEAIVLERESTSTRENVLFAQPIIVGRGYRRVALVTSRCHTPRAVAVARKLMPEVQWLVAGVEDAGPPARIRRTRAQEIAKRVWYKLRGWS